MSIQAMAWVFDHSQAEGIDRLVLLCLANHYNSQTGQCDPGYRRIADEARVGRSTVGDAVRRLIELGELSVIQTGAGHRSSKYHFPWLSTGDCKPGSSVQQPDARQLASGEGGPSVRLLPDRSLKQNQEKRSTAESVGVGAALPTQSASDIAARDRADREAAARADPDEYHAAVQAMRDQLGPAGSRRYRQAKGNP